jgi:hypothetical protein
MCKKRVLQGTSSRQTQSSPSAHAQNAQQDGIKTKQICVCSRASCRLPVVLASTLLKTRLEMQVQRGLVNLRHGRALHVVQARTWTEQTTKRRYVSTRQSATRAILSLATRKTLRGSVQFAQRTRSWLMRTIAIPRALTEVRATLENSSRRTQL